METRKFYFINEQYFFDFPDDNLMKNKEIIDGKEHNRPCYYTFKDNETEIYWLVPFSSRIEKFEKIHSNKVLKYGECDTIVFGYVLGEKKAFLIQNMCPVIEEYISNQYVDKNTGLPITISLSIASEIDKKAKKVLLLHKKGKKLIFPDVLMIEKILIEKLKNN